MLGDGHGINGRVSIGSQINVGIEADAEFQGTILSSASSQETSAGTKTLVTASSGKKLWVKRISFSVNVNQTNANGPFKLQIIDDSDVAHQIDAIWNPKTGAQYGGNMSPDYMESGTAKTIKLVIPTGFGDKLDWTVQYQEVDADA